MKIKEKGYDGLQTNTGRITVLDLSVERDCDLIPWDYFAAVVAPEAFVHGIECGWGS